MAVKVNYRGKHAEICRRVSEGKFEDALNLLYAFFRSEENTDSYSIELLTILRELLDEGDSDALGRLRIRMRKSGDKVFLNLAQFMAAFYEGMRHDEAARLSEKCFAELDSFKRSIQEYIDEEGMSPALELAGMRIHEGFLLWQRILPNLKTGKSPDLLVKSSLDVTRMLLFSKPGVMAGDMMQMARAHEKNGENEACLRLCREMADAYGDTVGRVKASAEFNREDYEVVDCLAYAYRRLNESSPDPLYSDRLAEIDQILNDDEE